MEVEFASGFAEKVQEEQFDGIVVVVEEMEASGFASPEQQRGEGVVDDPDAGAGEEKCERAVEH